MNISFIKKHFWFYYHLDLFLFSVLITLLMNYKQLGHLLDPTVIQAFLIIFFVSVNIGYLTVYMVKKAGKYDHKELSKKILPTLVLFYVAAFLIANIIVSIGILGFYLYEGIDLKGFFKQLFNYELNHSYSGFFGWLILFRVC